MYQLAPPPQPHVRVLAAPHPHGRFVFSVILVLAILVGTEWPRLVLVICICWENFDWSHGVIGWPQLTMSPPFLQAVCWSTAVKVIAAPQL